MGYMWIPRGSVSLLLGFPASAADLRRYRLPIRRIIRSPPPPPLLLPFAAVISMDKSRGSSCEALSGCKRRREDSPASAVDLELEASLRSKLESEQAAREQAARAREAWASGPERVQRSERDGVTGSGPQGSGYGPSPSPVLDPWEAAVASGGGVSLSSASLPVLGAGRGSSAPSRPLPPPPPRSFGAGSGARPPPRSFAGPARRPPGPASGAPLPPGMGDGILPPPPSLQQPRPSSTFHSNPSTLTCFACHKPPVSLHQSPLLLDLSL